MIEKDTQRIKEEVLRQKEEKRDLSKFNGIMKRAKKKIKDMQAVGNIKSIGRVLNGWLGLVDKEIEEIKEEEKEEGRF